MNAASNRGKSLAALGIAPGAQCNSNSSSWALHSVNAALLARRWGKKSRALHTNSNHAKTTASTTPAAIASISAALSDIRNSFGFALPRSHSNLKSLRFAVAPALAAISVTHDSRSTAGHRGFA